MKSFLDIQPPFIRAVRRLTKDKLYLGTTNQNLNGLLLKTPRISFLEGLRVYASIFPVLEWKTDLNTPLEEHQFESLIGSPLEIISFRIQAGSLLRRIDSASWNTLSTLLVESKSRIKIIVILSGDSTFAYSEKTLQELLDIREQLYPLPVFFEFENRSWKNPSSLKIFHSLEVGIIQRDMPVLSGFQVAIPNTNPKDFYLRLLGRNSDSWFSKESSQKYHYDYTRAELLQIINGREVGKLDFDRSFVIAAHHTPEQAVSNLLEFAHIFPID